MDEKLVQYFIAETNRKFEKLEHKIDLLLEFKWKAMGGILIFNFLVMAGLTILFGK